MLSPVAFPDGVPVDGYGPGFFRVEGEVIRGPLLILPSGRRAWGGWDDAAALLPEARSLDVLFLGTGPAMIVVPRAFRDACEGVPLEPMATGSACRTFNVLLSEGRRVGLAAIPA